MKPKYVATVLLFLFIVGGCTHSIEKKSESNFTPPSVKNQPRLLYPKFAQENGYTGKSKVIITVLQDGSVDKVNIFKSSGYEVLDNTALDYCKQIVFYPAERDGKLVASRILWDINFNITDVNMDANNYLFDLQQLYRNISFAKSPDERKYLQNEILKMHNNFVKDMKDALGFNIILEKILLPEVSAEWKEVWDSWPLSFLLYHDFIQRFKDYDSIADVKLSLNKALAFDIKYIENTNANYIETQKKENAVLLKIQDFVNKNYPEINLKKNI